MLSYCRKQAERSGWLYTPYL